MTSAIIDNTIITANSRRPKVLLLTSIGAALEYYDFSLFVFFAPIIGKLFFHTSTPAFAVIAGYAVFALGTLSRLVGGMFFSYFGDKYGRKITFIYTIFFMTLPSLLISLLPTYAQIGIVAPIFLIVLRLMQGAATGGEVPTAISFIAEYYPDKKKITACAFLVASIFSGLLLASIVQILLYNILSSEQFMFWGWRLAYFIGALFGIIGFIIRRRLQESPEFLAIKKQKKIVNNPILTVLKEYRFNVISGFMVLASIVNFVFIYFTFLPNYLTGVFAYDSNIVAMVNSLGMILSMVSTMLFGKICEYIDKHIILYIGCFVLFVICYPLFYCFSLHNIIYLFSCFVIIGILSGMLLAPSYPILAELFLTKIRITGIGLSLNLATIIFGAVGAEIFMILADIMHNKLAPAYFQMVCCLLSIYGLRRSRKLSQPVRST